MQLSFQYPHLLWLLALVPVLALLFLSYRRWWWRAFRQGGEVRLVQPLLRGYSPSRAIFKFSLLVLAFALGIVALANPRKEGGGEQEVRRGLDVVVALDVSRSMLAADVAPNRLGAARALVQRVMQSRPDDRMGLVFFAGHAYSQMPLSYDHTTAEMFLNAVDPGIIPAQGTALADALKKSGELLAVSEGRHKAVLLLSDGETFDEKSGEESAGERAAQLAEGGVMVITVGFGSPAGTTIMDPKTGISKKDREGNTVVSRLDEGLLQEIATKTAGSYIRFSNTEGAAGAVLEELKRVKEAALVDKSRLGYESLYLWALLPLVLLLLLEWLLPARKKEGV